MSRSSAPCPSTSTTYAARRSDHRSENGSATVSITVTVNCAPGLKAETPSLFSASTSDRSCTFLHRSESQGTTTHVCFHHIRRFRRGQIGKFPLMGIDEMTGEDIVAHFACRRQFDIREPLREAVAERARQPAPPVPVPGPPALPPGTRRRPRQWAMDGSLALLARARFSVATSASVRLPLPAVRGNVGRALEYPSHDLHR